MGDKFIRFKGGAKPSERAYTVPLVSSALGNRAVVPAFGQVPPGGKSGHQRTGWSVTPTGREARESATENKPPNDLAWLNAW